LIEVGTTFSNHLRMRDTPSLSVIIPCCNEAEVLPMLKARLLSCLDQSGLSWEVIFIDDGSTDSTLAEITALHSEEPRIKVIALSRNFGHQTAISAGLSYAAGEMVGIMDADLQDPPEVFVRMVGKLREGYDVVYAVRTNRKEDFLKRAGYALFYRLLKRFSDIDIPLDAGDFCVMNRCVAEVLKQMPERNVFLRGLRAWSGFRQTGLEYERGPRLFGKTKYSLAKLAGLGMDGIFSFSAMPLRLAIILGCFTVMFSVAWALLHVAWRVCGFRLMGHMASELPGWTTLACGMCFFAGIQLLLLGCIGEYIARIYAEVKQRPKWVIRELIGLERAERE
jgi:polyisoprenyl-phosphate glycosyltransferase